MESAPIYMDHHATTPVDPRVLEAMMPYLTHAFGNAASRSHAFGWRAEEAIERARQQVGRLVGAAQPNKEIVFTSGATESDNLALKGVMRQGLSEGRGDHLITVKTEHKAVIDSAKRLEREGARVTWLDVDAEGRVDPGDIATAIDEKTLLVSVMLANNETGTVQDMRAIGEITRERGVLLHCDATQGVGRLPFAVDDDNIDLASFTAHKIYGPKGAGALYVRRTGATRVRLIADIDGGGHERGMRSGTLNVPGIVGLGEACQIMADEGFKEAEEIAALRDRLFERLRKEIDDVHLNGAPPPERIAGNLNVSFPYVEGEALILALQKRVAVSSGSACNSASVEPSYVLRAMGLSRELADSSIRFGLGRGHTEALVDEVADFTIRQVKKLRKLSPAWQLKQKGIDPETIDW
jgi:cysteine desulfurase